MYIPFPDTQGESSFATFVCGGVFQQLAVAHDLSGKSEFCLSGEVRNNTFRVHATG